MLGDVDRRELVTQPELEGRKVAVTLREDLVFDEQLADVVGGLRPGQFVESGVLEWDLAARDAVEYSSWHRGHGRYKLGTGGLRGRAISCSRVRRRR